MTYEQELAIKSRIRERDGNRCVQCGLTAHEHIAAHGKNLEVHRITPGSEYSLEDGVCVTLCRGCHGPKPRRPRGTLPKKNRVMVSIAASIHDEMRLIADQNCGPINRQVTLACIAFLEKAGAWPPSNS